MKPLPLAATTFVEYRGATGFSRRLRTTLLADCLAFSCILLACQCAPYVRHEYPGPKRPLSEVAVLYACGDLSIGLDGGYAGSDKGVAFAVPPGIHQVEGSYWYTEQINTRKFRVISGQCTPLTFRAEAGKEYAIWLDKTTFRMRVREVPEEARRTAKNN